MLTISAAHKIAIDNGWLSVTPTSFQNTVLEGCRLRCFKAGESIFRVGDPPGGMFALVSGSVGVSIAPGERGPYFVHLAQPGTWFGEAAAITRRPVASG